MGIKLTKGDVIWSYIGTILSMGANLIMLPFIIYYLDSDTLGLWYVFTSLGAIATLFDCGFSITFARNITYCWSGASFLRKEDVVFSETSEPNYKLMKSVLATCKDIYLIISASALFFLLSLGTIYIRYISRDIEGKIFFVAWIIYSLAIFLNLYYGYYTAFLRGVGAVAQAQKNTVIARLVQIFLTIALLFVGAGIVGVCVAYLAYGTVLRVFGKRKFYKYNNIGNELKYITHITSRREKIELFHIVWHNAWRDGVISLTDYFCNQITTIICSLYFSLTETGIYSLGVQLATAIGMISGTLYSAYQPSIQEAYISENVEKLRKIMAIIVMSLCYLFVFFILCAEFIGLPLLRIIKPEVIVSGPLLLGLSTYQFLLRYRNSYTSYFSCTNRIPYLKSFMISAAICVALSFLFVGYFHLGIVGLVVAQIISQGIYNVWYWPRKAKRELGLTTSSIVIVGTKELYDIVSCYFKKNSC